MKIQAQKMRSSKTPMSWLFILLLSVFVLTPAYAKNKPPNDAKNYKSYHANNVKRHHNKKNKHHHHRYSLISVEVDAESCKVYLKSKKPIRNIIFNLGEDDEEKIEYIYETVDGTYIASPIGKSFELGDYADLIDVADDVVHVKAGNNGRRGVGKEINLDVPETDACEISVKSLTLEAFNNFRKQVEPPCDPEQSPCDITGFLPEAMWSAELADVSKNHVATCPLFFVLPEDLPENTHQAQYLFPQATGVTSIIQAAFSKWNVDGKQYDAVTGYAYSGDTLTYKALVNTTATEIGAAVKLDCTGGPTGVFSVFHAVVRQGPPDGPAYPVLIDQGE